MRWGEPSSRWKTTRHLVLMESLLKSSNRLRKAHTMAPRSHHEAWEWWRNSRWHQWCCRLWPFWGKDTKIIGKKNTLTVLSQESSCWECLAFLPFFERQSLAGKCLLLGFSCLVGNFLISCFIFKNCFELHWYQTVRAIVDAHCIVLIFFFTNMMISVWCAQLLWSCPTLCDPMDCSPPGASVHGILQVRMLEWVAIPFSRGSSQLSDNLSLPHCRGILHLLSHRGRPWTSFIYLFSTIF